MACCIFVAGILGAVLQAWRSVFQDGDDHAQGWRLGGGPDDQVINFPSSGLTRGPIKQGHFERLDGPSGQARGKQIRGAEVRIRVRQQPVLKAGAA